MTIEFTPLFCYAIAFAAVFISTAGQILLKRQANSTVGKKGFIVHMWGSISSPVVDEDRFDQAPRIQTGFVIRSRL